MESACVAYCEEMKSLCHHPKTLGMEGILQSVLAPAELPNSGNLQKNTLCYLLACMRGRMLDALANSVLHGASHAFPLPGSRSWSPRPAFISLPRHFGAICKF